MKLYLVAYKFALLVTLLGIGLQCMGAQPSVPLAIQKKSLAYSRFADWMRKKYDAKWSDIAFLWRYGNKKVQRQKISKKEAVQAKKIMKKIKSSLSAIVIAVAAALGGVILIRKKKAQGELNKGTALGVSNDLLLPSEFPLTRAIFNNNMDRVLELIREGVDVNTELYRGYTPLIEAVWAGKKDAVALLLQERANVEAKTFRGKTALDKAFESYSMTPTQRAEIIKLLLEGGARPKDGYICWAAILYRSNRLDESNAKEIIKVLIEAGANPERYKSIPVVAAVLKAIRYEKGIEEYQAFSRGRVTTESPVSTLPIEVMKEIFQFTTERPLEQP